MDKRMKNIEDVMLENLTREAANLKAPWVLFQYGTVVFVDESWKDPKKEAVGFLEKHGLERSQTASLVEMEGGGWFLTTENDEIMTYISTEEVGEDPELDIIFLYGRQKMFQDTNQLNVVMLKE
jgi:hypothetical protein